jgi:hypothetical protein
MSEVRSSGVARHSTLCLVLEGFRAPITVLCSWSDMNVTADHEARSPVNSVVTIGSRSRVPTYRATVRTYQTDSHDINIYQALVRLDNRLDIACCLQSPTSSNKLPSTSVHPVAGRLKHPTRRRSNSLPLSLSSSQYKHRRLIQESRQKHTATQKQLAT